MRKRKRPTRAEKIARGKPKKKSSYERKQDELNHRKPSLNEAMKDGLDTGKKMSKASANRLMEHFNDLSGGKFNE